MKSFTLGAMAVVAGIVTGAPAHAADNVMKVCGAKYQAAKSSKTLPAGQTWNQYLAACRVAQPKTAAAAPAPATTAPAARSIVATTAPAAAPAKSGWTSMFHKSAPAAPAAAPVAAAHSAATAPTPVAARAAGTQSPGMIAAHDRQRQCGAQWKADKAAGKIPAGQTWPKYWSACNTRLKG